MAVDTRLAEAASAPKAPYLEDEGDVLLSGVQALVRLLFDQRRTDRAASYNTAGFVTGYPGSPLAGLDLELERRRELLGLFDIVHRPGLNEELAATAVAGSQLASIQDDRLYEGVSALWYAKAPGLDRAGDAIRHGNLMGASRRGGVLVCVGDDPEGKSSSVPSTSEPSLFALGLPVLSPADPQEVLTLGLHGYAISRAAGLWVGMRLPATVADGRQRVSVGPGLVRPKEPDLQIGERAFSHEVTAQLLGAKLVELEASLYGPRLEVVRRYAAANGLNRVTASHDHDVFGIVAAGPAYLAVRHGLERLGLGEQELEEIGVRLFKVDMPYPLDEEAVRRFAAGLQEVFVLEDKRPFLETLVKDALYRTPGAPLVTGKRDEGGQPLLPAFGELDLDTVTAALAKRLLRHREVGSVASWQSGQPRQTTTQPAPLTRTPYFCSGCPHSSGVRVPEDALVGSGSGCHGLAIQMSPRLVGRIAGRFQMGGEGAMWNGMEPFVAAEHFFQNLGDGTFAHSGSLAVRAAVAAGVNTTFKLLSNSTVAMTGGQEIVGGRQLSDLVELLLAEGVGRVIVTTDHPGDHRYSGLPSSVDVWHRSRLVEAAELLAAQKGVTVLLHDQPCAAELRRARARRLAPALERRVFINPLVCDGCGECGEKSNCLSVRPIETELGPSTVIHQESCNGDYLCLEADCPALVTITRAGRPRPAGETVDRAELPEPLKRPLTKSYGIRIAGIGGTGVVTLAEILSRAALSEGLFIQGINQTGIAQKGGPVLSDIRLGNEAVSRPARLGAGECDLYLGCDLVVGSDPKSLRATDEHRTVAVVSTSRVPTGRQVADRSISFPPTAVFRALIEARCGEGGIFLDASELSRRLLGSDVHANVLLLGAAYQLGALPLGSGAIEQAISSLGVSVEANLRAFREGRLAVTAPARGESPAVGVTPGDDLDAFAAARMADLTSYMDGSYAARYRRRLEAARAAELLAGGQDDGPFARAVALELYRLMAYKDEYEVARLHLEPAFRRSVTEAFGEDARISFNLRPPLLAAAGLDRKIRLDKGADQVLKALAARRRLRSSKLDPFGRTAVRRLDTELLSEYESLVDEMTERITSQNRDWAAQVVGLVSSVRGFGQRRQAAAERYRRELTSLLAEEPGSRDGDLLVEEPCST